MACMARLARGLALCSGRLPRGWVEMVWLYRAAVLAFLAVSAAPQAVAQPRPILLGTHTDLSGPAALYGVAVVNAMRLRLDAVNAAGGIHGRPVRLIVEDHGFQLPRAVQATNKLIQRDRVLAIVGALGVPMNNVALPIQLAANVPNLFPMAASRSMIEPPHPLKFLSGSLYYDQLRAGLGWMLAQKGKKAVCTLYQDTDFGAEALAAIRDTLGPRGLTMLESVSHKPTDTEFGANVTRLRNAGCDLVVLATLFRDTLLAMGAAKRMGWEVDFLGPSTVYDYVIEQAPGAVTQGLYAMASIALPYRDSAPPEAIAWMDAYKRAYGAEPNAGAIYGAAIIDLAVLALDRAGPHPTGPGVARAAESISGFRDIFGGTVQSFSAQKRQGTQQAYVYRLEGPRFRRLTEALGYQ